VLWAATATALGARTAARNRDYSSPLRLAEVTFEHWPTAYSRHGLALQLLVAGRRAEALAELRQAIPGDERAHLSLGRLLFEDGQLREAREQLETFVRLRPLREEAVEARALIGRALLAEGRLDEAAEQFRQVLQMQSSYVDGYVGLAEVFLAQERPNDAVTQYRAYVAKGGRNPRVLSHLGAALVRAGRIDEAIQSFQRAIELTDAPEAHRSLAAVLMDRNDVAAAFRHAERAVALNPGDAAARDLLGITLAAQGRRDLAALQFRESLRLDPSDDMVRKRLEQVLRP